MKPVVLGAVMALLSLPMTAAAQTFADPQAVDAAVAAFTGAMPGEPGGAQRPVDRRLRLAACRQALAVEWHGPAALPRRDTVQVRCPDAGGWRIFVPLLTGAGTRSDLPAVGRGEAVTISVIGTGFAVSQPGEALEAGPVGAWIKVRVAGKNEPLRAQVVRPGLVSVPVP